MNLFADTVIDPTAVNADVPIDLSAVRERALQFDQIGFPERLPANAQQLLALARRSYISGYERDCIVTCRSIVERALEYLSWYQEYKLGTRQNTSMREMLEQACNFQLISDEACIAGVRIWREGSELVHGQVVPTRRAIHVLIELAGLLKEIAPHLGTLPSRSA